jgi:hypothetical protein
MSSFAALARAAVEHQPKKVLESKQAIVFDDFLPEEIYQRVNQFALKTDYRHINTNGRMSRAWHIHDGFPLRSLLDLFYFPNEETAPEADSVYPTGTEWDLFTDHLLAIEPAVEHMVDGWHNLSVTGWIYPPGTGLTMHTDGGAYTGAFVYYLNPTWRTHWGGILVLADEAANRAVHDYRNTHDQQEFYDLKWLNANHVDELMMDHGFGECIFPKKNRIVFVDRHAYHMVTRVNEAAGDNVRMSLAGFFHKGLQECLTS